MWNLGHPGWLCTELVKWLGIEVVIPCPKLAYSLEKGRAGVSLKPSISVFLEVPIIEALCADSQGRLQGFLQDLLTANGPLGNTQVPFQLSGTSLRGASLSPTLWRC